MPKTFTVNNDFHGTRLDRWFKKEVLDLPHSLIEKIIRQNKIKINNKKTKSSYRVQEGDVINVFQISQFKSNKKNSKPKYKPSKKEIKSYDKYIIENNENFVVVNKPSGIPVQSGTKSFKNIIDILKDTTIFEENTKPYLVHRIDKETSGILLVAKNKKYAQLFTSLFRIRKIHKTYLAITYGKVSTKEKVLKDHLVTFENRKKITQKAISYCNVLKSNDLYSLVELNPITGRKHQLRKQLLNIGNPIVGDDKYFNNFTRSKTKNLMLHAYKIKFMINNKKYNFKAKYNEYFENFLKKNI